ncbi:MAG: hypothetical protein A2W22_00625 [Candidatus Levybacteria bacterium RBG_16_35_11]|nr:MAG: hypothetical protein A2W22_00625 [Candidatus Levybacteria bacterium RBG_16_35_11]
MEDIQRWIIWISEVKINQQQEWIKMSNDKMEIQNTMEKLLEKHGINPSHDFHLKLSNKPYMDLVLEKYGSTIIVGHYFVQNGDLMGDPILAMEDISDYWSPLRIEEWSNYVIRDTICAFYKDGKLTIYPDRIKDFMNFQRLFACRIKKQGWLKFGVKEIPLLAIPS